MTVYLCPLSSDIVKRVALPRCDNSGQKHLKTGTGSSIIFPTDAVIVEACVKMRHLTWFTEYNKDFYLLIIIIHGV